jgi:hypothetical protein
MPLCRTRIRVVESNQQKLTLSIPGAGPQAGLPPRRSMGCFIALAAFSIPVATRIIATRDPYVIALLGIAEIAAFGVIALSVWKWFRARYTHVILHLEHDLIALERTLLGRRRVEAGKLPVNAQALLAETYREKRGPFVEVLYEVSIHGRIRDFRFGLSLSEMEKEWLVEQINAFLTLPSAD